MKNRLCATIILLGFLNAEIFAQPLKEDTSLIQEDHTVSSEWLHSDLKIIRKGQDLSESERSIGEFIYTNMAGSVGNVALMCAQGELTAAVSTNGEDIKPKVHVAWLGQKFRATRPDLEIGGESEKAYVWAFQQRNDLLLPLKTKVSRKIYNASILKQAVRVDVESRPAIDLILPSPNRVFADFGGDCGIGQLAEKK